MITGDVCSSASEETAVSALKRRVEMEKKQNAQQDDIRIVSVSGSHTSEQTVLAAGTSGS